MGFRQEFPKINTSLFFFLLLLNFEDLTIFFDLISRFFLFDYHQLKCVDQLSFESILIFLVPIRDDLAKLCKGVEMLTGNSIINFFFLIFG
jgi:hypothetical protein